MKEAVGAAVGWGHGAPAAGCCQPWVSGNRCASAVVLGSDVAAAARLRQLWMAITFSLCSFFVGKQWAELEMVSLPRSLARMHTLLSHPGSNLPPPTYR